MNYDEKTLQYMTLIEAEMGGMLGGNGDSSVLEAMRYSLLGGGKRVRGVLALAACETCCGEFEKAAPAAAAIEMVHCYSLIHDDLPAMDDDDLRRGKPSCHTAFGEATAILAGDALLTLAFGTLAKLSDPKAAIECVSILSSAAGHKGMILGQELDLATEGKRLTPAQLSRVHNHKTGMLIAAPVRMGALLGGADARQARALEEFAVICGLVFQLVDDILDATATTQALGKPVGSDAEMKKFTAVSLYGIDRARQISTELTAKAVALLTANFSEVNFLIEFAKRLLIRTK